MSYLKSKFISISGLINKGHERSVKAKKNILALIIIKGGSIAVSLLLVPMTLNYVNPTRYGIWITLSSIIAWFSFFDIGFGNGLKNKFAECIAKGQHEIARIYVSTTYAILSILIILVLLAFFLINPFINWTKILNTSSDMAGELSILALIVFVFFCLQFVLQLITTVMTAKQEPAKASLLNLLGSVFSLLIIFVLTKTTSGNLIYLASALGITPILVLAFSSIWFFKFQYRNYSPAIKYVKFSYARNLMSLGIKFFIIQIGAVVFYQTDNIVVTQLFGPKEVTTFNIAYKLFSVLIMFFFIIITPLWSAFTDAYTSSDFQWIIITFKKVKKVWYLLILLTILLLFTSTFIFKLWIGESIEVPFSLSVALSFYVIVNSWQAIYIHFLNGIGKIHIQLYLVIVFSILNIPIAIFLGKRIGLAGITYSNTVIFIIMGIIYAIQAKKIINNRANGIWNK
ncbi:MAG TPA: oligosaccharide flippase family protein [Ignavibacteria bacterium]